MKPRGFPGDVPSLVAKLSRWAKVASAPFIIGCLGEQGAFGPLFGSSNGEHPGFSGFLPTWGFGSPGDLGSPQYRPTVPSGILHGTAGSKNDFFPVFHHQKFNRQFSHQMVSWYGWCPLSWGVWWVKCDLRCFGGRRKKVIFTRPAVPHLISKRYRM